MDILDFEMLTLYYNWSLNCERSSVTANLTSTANVSVQQSHD